MPHCKPKVLRTLLTRRAPCAPSRPNAVGLRHRGGHPLRAARTNVPANAAADGIQIVDGRELSTGLSGLSGHEILRDAGKAVLARLREYRTAAQDDLTLPGARVVSASVQLAHPRADEP